MRHLSLCIAVLALSATLQARPAHAQLSREITSQYRPALARIQQAYTRGTFSGTLSVTEPQSGKSRRQDFTMRANGEFRRLDLTTLAQQGMKLEVGAKVLAMATPNGSLNTFTKPNADAFGDATQTSYADTVTQIDQGCLLYYTYSLGGGATILDTLTKPGVKITGVKTVEAFGEKLLQINYDENARYAGHSGLWKSRVVIAPSEAWALRGFTRTSGHGSNQIIQRAKLGYSGIQDGIPVLGSIESETLVGGKPTKREAVSITDIQFGEPDGAYFTSFAF
jgi:hypothetical protein